MNKIRILGILTLISFSLFIGIFPNEINPQIEDLVTKQDSFQETTAKDPDFPESMQTSEILQDNPPTDFWIEGETLKVNYDFFSLIPSADQSFWRDHHIYTESEDRGLGNPFSYLFTDDSGFLRVSGASELESTSFYDIYQFIFDIGIQSPRRGTIKWIADTYTLRSTFKSGNHPYLQIMKPSGSITTWYSDDTLYSGDLEDYIHPDGKVYALLWLGWDSDAVDNSHRAACDIDQFAIDFDELISFPRVEYRYTSQNIIEYRLKLWNPATSNITINLPSDWSVSSISPIVDYSIDSDNDLTLINALGNTEFTLFFSFSPQKQYLSISNFRYQDFEGNGGSNLNSTIVSNGAFSERMTSGSLNFESSDIPEGYYYTDFDCYLETAPSAVVLQYYNGGSWINASYVNVSKTDRWQHLFAYLQPSDTISGYTIRVVVDGTGIIFLDDINFNIANQEPETIAWETLLVSGDCYNWDGYNSPAMETQKLNVSIWDNSSKTIIVSENLTMDSLGHWYLLINTSEYSDLKAEKTFGINSSVYSSESSVTNVTTNYYIPETIDSSSCVLFLTETYAFCSSENDTFQYRIEIDNILQEYSVDLYPFNINMSLGTHLINVTPYLDFSRSGVFLPGSSITDSFEVAITVFSVWFDFVDGVGIGLDWESFKLYVNNSRQYSQQLTVSNNTLLHLEVLDYFNISLLKVNYTITSNKEIPLVIDVFNVIFRNNNTQFKSVVEIKRSDQILKLNIEPGGTISHRFTQGRYSLNVSYVVDEKISFDIKNPKNYTVGSHFLYKSNIDIGTRLKFMGETLDSNIVDVGAPNPEPTIIGLVQIQMLSSFVVGLIIGSLISALLSYIWRTRFIEPIDRRVDFGTLKKSGQKPIIETSADLIDILPLTERRRQSKIHNPRKGPNERRRA